MVCCTLCSIKTRTNMKLDTFLFILFCCLFGVYDMRFNHMVIVKKIVFTCIIYATTVYH